MAMLPTSLGRPEDVGGCRRTLTVLTAPFRGKARVGAKRRHLAANILRKTAARLWKGNRAVGLGNSLPMGRGSREVLHQSRFPEGSTP